MKDFEQLISYCNDKNEKMALALISLMSDDAINHIDSYKNIPLILACYNSLSEVTLALISLISDDAINHIDNYKNTALKWEKII